MTVKIKFLNEIMQYYECGNVPIDKTRAERQQSLDKKNVINEGAPITRLFQCGFSK